MVGILTLPLLPKPAINLYIQMVKTIAASLDIRETR